MVEVAADLVTVSGKQLVTEASTIGLAVGEWPDFIAVTRGAEGELFGPAWMPLRAGGRAYFSQTSSLVLHVLND